MEPVTVSQLNRYVKSLISSDNNLSSVTVKGEISNFTNHVKTGHFYFTLKDKESSIKAVMFRFNAQRVKFEIENGMNVIINGSVSVFERDGVYQLYCEQIEPDGIGALYLAFEQLKEKLSREGLFAPELKKPIPLFPQKIGVVTSKTGAALQDILNILSRRYPIGKVVLFPALVQGEQAPLSIVKGIEQANAAGDIDVLIVGRGGGSIEDLWCFNDERVARAVVSSSVPVISAVGHEIDFTIIDFVADLRAPTPSAAAELCSVDIASIYTMLQSYRQAIETGCLRYTESYSDKLSQLRERLLNASPKNKTAECEKELLFKLTRLNTGIESIIKAKEKNFIEQIKTLEALSPLKVLTRGYSITYKDDEIINSANKLEIDDVITTRFKDGVVKSVVTERAMTEETYG